VPDEFSPQILLDFTENEMIVTWIGRNYKKRLIYNTDTCVGCGLCVEVCPTGAISLGPIPQIATGKMDGKFAKITFDQDKCQFCGLCAEICPINAIIFEINGQRIETLKEYPRIVGSIRIDKEKCIPCRICETICPTRCIEVRIQLKKKEDLVRYKKMPEKIEGEIKINEEKCTFCGICAELCDAIVIEWKKPDPSDLTFASSISVNLEKCDFCGLCAEICPDEAIEVKCITPVEREIEIPRITGDVVINEENCIYCGWCTNTCPRNAIEVKKRFEGKIKLFHIEKCDPLGCKACINICPVNCWYIPKDPEREGKIAVNESLCIFCGSCERACPENIIKVEITSVNIIDPEVPSLWAGSRKRAIIDATINRETPKHQRYAKIEIEERIPAEELREVPSVPEDVKDELQQRLKRLEDEISKIGIRRLIERGKFKKLT